MVFRRLSMINSTVIFPGHFLTRQMLSSRTAACSLVVVILLSFTALSRAEGTDCRSGTLQDQANCLRDKNRAIPVPGTGEADQPAYTQLPTTIAGWERLYHAIRVGMSYDDAIKAVGGKPAEEITNDRCIGPPGKLNGPSPLDNTHFAPICRHIDFKWQPPRHSYMSDSALFLTFRKNSVGSWELYQWSVNPEVFEGLN